jgi:hypothetical protein
VSTSAVIEEMLDDLEEFVNLTDGVGDMLNQLHALGEADAPAPDGELLVLLAGTTRAPAAALVTGAVRVPARPHTGARRSVLVGLAVAVVVAMGITSAAAAVNELPASMQRVVAHFSETYLPFSFPRPVGDPPTTGGARHSRADEGSTGATKGTRTDGASAAHRRDVAAKARAQALAEARANAHAKARAEAGAKARADAQAKAHADEARSASSGGPDSSLPDGEEDNGSAGSGHGSSSGGAGGGGAGQGSGTGTGGSTHAHQGHAGTGQSSGGTAGKGVPPRGSDVHPGKATSGHGSERGVAGTGGSGRSS